MGQCAQCANSTRKLQKSKSKEVSLGQPVTNRNQHLRKQFIANLLTARIENMSELIQTKLYIIFSIAGIVQYELPKSSPARGKIQWKVEKEFQFSLLQQESMQKMLKITVLTQQGNKIDSLFINLHEIIVGPSRYDFNIGKKGKPFARLVFNLKIAQLVSVKFSIKEALLLTNKDYPEDKFNFALEFYDGLNKVNVKSIPSYKTVVENQNRKILTSSQQISIDNQFFGNSKKPKMNESFMLLWEAKFNQRMPSLQVRLKSCDILSKICIVKIFKFIDQKKFIEFAHSAFTLSQVLTIQNQKMVRQTSGEEKHYRQVSIENIASLNSKMIGKCIFQVTAEFKNFYTQKMGCTRTEDGVIHTNQMYLYKMEPKSEQKNFQFLKNIYNRLATLIDEKYSSNSFYFQSAKSLQINQTLQQLNFELNNGIQKSYVYQTTKSDKLLNIKNLSLSLMQLLTSVIQENDIDQSDLCWANIVCLLKRGQMMLKYWKFEEKDKDKVIGCKVRQNQESESQNLKSALKYAKVLKKLLVLSLQTDIQIVSDGNKINCEIFKVQCYFRVPIFRKKIIHQAALRCQLKQTEFQLYELANQIQFLSGGRNEKTSPEADWQKMFWDYVEMTDTGKEIVNSLTCYLEQCQWIQYTSRTIQLSSNLIRLLIGKFSFIKEHEKIYHWPYFEGYSFLIKNFLLCLIEENINHIANEATSTIVTVIQNQQVVFPLLKILFKKTNLYNSFEVLQLAHTLTHILAGLTKKDKILSKFPYNQLMKPIKVILESDHSLSVSYYLTLLYTFYEKFEEHFRYQLVCYLFGGGLWKLCFHWSYSIRKIFYHFVILKISQDEVLRKHTDVQMKIKQFCILMVNIDKIAERKVDIGLKKKNQQYYTVMKNKLKKKKEEKSKQEDRQKHYKTQWPSQQIDVDDLLIFEQFDQKNDDFLCNANKILLVKHKLLSLKRKPFSETSKQIKNLSQSQVSHSGQTPKLLKRPSYLDHKFVYTCFNQQDFVIPPIHTQKKLLSYCHTTKQQFSLALDSVVKHFECCKKFPIVEFDFKFKIDEKDLLPDGFQIIDFQ